MTDDMTRARTDEGMPRRTLVKAAAWSVPVVAIAAAMPASGAATSGEPEPPTANYALVSAVVNPKAGTNPTFRAYGQVLDDDGNYEDGTLRAGTELVITFENGATAASINGLVGLTFVSGDPTTGGPVYFTVTSDTASVALRTNNVQPAGGTISVEILGGSGTSNIIA
ncbi:MAG: hypothetical protein WA971_05830 [Microbacterium sp.]